MTITLQEYFVGIDVSKDKLDVAILGQKTVTQSTNTRRGMAGLIRQMHKLLCSAKSIGSSDSGNLAG